STRQQCPPIDTVQSLQNASQPCGGIVSLVHAMNCWRVLDVADAHFAWQSSWAAGVPKHAATPSHAAMHWAIWGSGGAVSAASCASVPPCASVAPCASGGGAASATGPPSLPPRSVVQLGLHVCFETQSRYCATPSLVALPHDALHEA